MTGTEMAWTKGISIVVPRLLTGKDLQPLGWVRGAG